MSSFYYLIFSLPALFLHFTFFSYHCSLSHIHNSFSCAYVFKTTESSEAIPDIAYCQSLEFFTLRVKPAIQRLHHWCNTNLSALRHTQTKKLRQISLLFYILSRYCSSLLLISFTLSAPSLSLLQLRTIHEYLSWVYPLKVKIINP